jgi:hypothetical protein
MAEVEEVAQSAEKRQIRLRKRVVRDRQADMRLFALVLALAFVAFLILLRSLFAGTQAHLAESDAARTEDLYFTLRIEDRSFAKGQPIGLKLSVRNTSGQPVSLPFDTDQEFDFVVQRQLNLFFVRLPLEIWRHSAGRPAQPNPHSLMIMPGEERIFRANWKQVDNSGHQVRPGRYIISGYVNNSGERHSLHIQAP